MWRLELDVGRAVAYFGIIAPFLMFAGKQVSISARKLMRKPLLAAFVLPLLVGACGTPDYKRDPDYVACNVGGPLGRTERSLAMAPNPQAIPGRPPDCRMVNGVLRRVPGG